MEQKKIAILYNPTASSGMSLVKLKKLEACLQQKRVKFKTYNSNRREEVIGEYEVVFVVGGDGTLHNVIESVLKSSNKEIKLVCVPAGTGNNAAMGFNMPRFAEGIYDVFEKGVSKKIDLGEVNGDHFIAGLSLGFPAKVLKERNRHVFKLWKLSYFLAALEIFFRNKPCNLKIGLDNTVIAQLLFLESQDPKKDINLYVNSPGGSVSGTLAVYDTIQHIKPDVSTICVGIAASGGAILLSSGKKGKRFALPNSEVMIHQVLGTAEGQAVDIDITARHILRIKDRLNKILAKHTGQLMQKIEKDTDRDFFMSADEAKTYGIVDQIVKAKNHNSKAKK